MKTLWLLLVALFLAGCASLPKEAPKTVLPPLPEEAHYLWDYYGRPEIYPAVATTMVWKDGEERIYLTLAYDQFFGWLVMGYKIKGNRTVPDEIEMYMYMAMRRSQFPSPGWGGAVPVAEGKACKRREF
jgi:hypothetical protein